VAILSLMDQAQHAPGKIARIRATGQLGRGVGMTVIDGVVRSLRSRNTAARDAACPKLISGSVGYVTPARFRRRQTRTRAPK